MSEKDNSPVRVLVIVRWPLGGIRTYMRYVFKRFPSRVRLSVLAVSTHEDDALRADCAACKAELKLARVASTRSLALQIFHELSANRYDVLLSQGFISAVAVSFANFYFRIPHILTVHGIVEPRYLVGRASLLKRLALEFIFSRVTCLYAVSKDILEHLYCQFPRLKLRGPTAVIIDNGIELTSLDAVPAQPVNLRLTFGIAPSAFLFGFLGRFMPQKGFDLIIEAVSALVRGQLEKTFAILAIGSGDYLREYQAMIRERELADLFYFLPFQPLAHHLLPQLDTVLMPSRWEASGLLAMEALCMGVPLIASDCLGLRETVAATPTRVFLSEDATALSGAMHTVMQSPPRHVFQDFIPSARCRYDVTHTADQLLELICQVLTRK